ncbi:MAG TPA: hypothetical protein VLI72_12155 [Methylibium sp.]|nr:hypothetical protein [Methylibium sp.]
MLKLSLLYVHLLGTCLALGLVLASDARVLARALGWDAVLEPPSRFVRGAIGFALALLLASGAALVTLGLTADPHYLANPKLQGKLLLVTLLCANATVLHHRVFPLLKSGRPVSRWRAAQRNRVALAVGLSSSLWLYCAFLGIARPWNQVVPLGTVLAVGMVVFALFAVATRFALTLAARPLPRGEPAPLDHLKRTLRTAQARMQRRVAQAPGRGDLPTTVTAAPTAALPRRAAA